MKLNTVPTLSLTFSLLAGCTTIDSQNLRIPKEAPLNQHQVHRLACGPCSLIHAFAHASRSWVHPSFSQLSFMQQADYITKTLGETASVSHSGKDKWDSSRGMSIDDLTDIVNTISPRKVASLAPPKSLSAQHKNLTKSLSQGFPPIVSIKQQIHKKFRSQEGYYWIATNGHFVVITAIAPKIDQETNSIWFEYVDSFDAKTHRGKITAAPTESFLTTSPLTRQPIQWKPTGSPVVMPSLQISNRDFPVGGKLTTEIDQFIIGAH